MNEAQKQRLAALKAMKAEELSDAEKSELELLTAMEKMAKQIVEKDSLLGTRATELDNLKKDLEKAKDGKEKDALEERIKEKEDALEIAKAGLQALKDAQELNAKNAERFTKLGPGHGESVDPKELEALEAKAYGDEKIRAEVEKQYKGWDQKDKDAFRNDPKFRKLVFEGVLGTGGDQGDDSPWGAGVKKAEGETNESAEERIKRLFGQQARNGQQLPPFASGRMGHGRRGEDSSKPVRSQRPVDTRTE